jgi:hypothetical protein
MPEEIEMTRSRPIVHDSSYPLAGSRARRRLARDDGPLEARSALQNHMQKSMGDDDYTKACILLGYFERALLGPDVGEGEGDPAAMDARFDSRPSVLAGMFSTSINPRLAPNAGARDLSATDSRVLDHRPSELAKLFSDAPNPSARIR